MKLYGYDIKELTILSEILKSSNITVDQLHHTVESFKRGYELGQKDAFDCIERTTKQFYEELENKKEKGI